MNYIKNLVKIDNIIMLFFLIIILLSSIVPLSDPDMFFHIKNGEYIVNNGIPQIDPYTIHSDLEYIQHEWLSDIIFYSIYSIDGFTSLLTFKIIMTFVLFLILFYTTTKFTTNKLLSFGIAAVSTFLLRPFIVIRPQIFSYIIFIVELLLLEQYHATKDKKYLFVLPLLSLLLINIHGAATPLFFIILSVYLISDVFSFEFNQVLKLKYNKINKKSTVSLIIITLLSSLTMLLNPHGIQTIFYVFNIFGNNNMFNYINELKPLSIKGFYGPYVFGIFFIIVGVNICAKKTFSIKQLLFIFGTFVMALSSIRFCSYFIIFSLIFFAQYLNDVLPQNLIKPVHKIYIFIPLLIIVLAIGITFKTKNYNFQAVNMDKFPTEAVEIIKTKENIRLFNTFGIGHFLIFNDIKVFIDGRAEMYTKKCNNTEVFNDYIDAKYKSTYPGDIFEKYNLNFYLVSKDSRYDMFLKHHEEYEKLYEEESYNLYKLKDI